MTVFKKPGSGTNITKIVLFKMNNFNYFPLGNYIS